MEARDLFVIERQLSPQVIETLRREQPDAVFLPITPVAFGSVVRAGIEIPVELHWWRFTDPNRIHNLLPAADLRCARWLRTLAELQSQLPRPLQALPLTDLDRTVLWYWSLQLEFLGTMLDGLEDRFPRLEQLHMLQTEGAPPHALYDSGIPLLAFLGSREQNRRWRLIRHRLPSIDKISHPASPEPLHVSTAASGSRGDIDLVVFHALGIPELPLRLRALARKPNRRVLVVVDEFFSGNLETLGHVAQEMGNIEFLPLFGETFEEHQRQVHEQLILPRTLLDAAEMPPEHSPLILELANRQWPRHLVLRDLFTQLFKASPPCLVVGSDHASPEGLLLTMEASVRNIPIYRVAHSGFPVPAPFAFPPSYSASALYGWTRSAGRQFIKNGQTPKHHPTATRPVRPLPVRGIYPFYLRPRRMLQRLKHRSGPMTIGILLTTEITVEMETLIAGLRRLLDAPSIGPNFLLRVRDNYDDIAMMHHLLSNTAATAQLTIEQSSSRPALGFFLDSDLIVEAGTPSSAALETFATLKPYFRLDTETGQNRRFAFPPGLVPQLDPDDPWSELRHFAEHPWHRRILALRQHGWLLRETATGWFRQVDN